MPDISDKELDQFFKDSIEQPDVPFEEGAWAKMEQSLNKHDQKQRVRRYRNYAILGLAVYLLSAVSVRTLKYADENSSSFITSVEKNNASFPPITSAETTVKKSRKAIEQTNDAAMQDEPVSSSAASIAPSETTLAAPQETVVNTTNNVSHDKTTLTKGTIEKEKKKKEYPAAAIKNHHRKHNKQERETRIAIAEQEQPMNSEPSETNYTKTDITTAETNNTILADALARSSKEEQQTASTLSPEQETKNTSNTNSKETTESKQNLPNDNSLALTADSALQTLPTDSLLPLASQTSKDSTLPKDKAPLRRRFSFGIFASPDYSITSSAQFVSPGLLLGLFLEYHINHRLTVFTGVMRSSKIYSSNGNDYTATDRYWAYKGMTSRIDGSCTVVDVPLNVKYHFYNRGKNLLFASAGLSSYFMLNEQYTFKYSNTYYADRSWSYDTKRNYFFGIVNASLGYERCISKSFSVQVEPFIKIPLGTVGDGLVKLTTTGMFFYLKYTIQK